MLGLARALPFSRAQLLNHTRRHYSRPAAASGLRRHGRGTLAFGLTAVGAVALGLSTHTVFLDADIAEEDVVVDKDTSIAFPKILRIQSKAKLPDFHLVGVGVRTVSFLGIRVYSVGFYADLANPSLIIPHNATPEEKVEHIVRNTACVLRIIPTRSTNYTHLRDGFVRAVQARVNQARASGAITPDEEFAAQAPIRQLKTLFPNTPLAKGTPLDILLTAPEPNGQRALIFRDLGVVQDAWVTREFVLNYFIGQAAPSPPLRKMVLEKLESFGI